MAMNEYDLSDISAAVNGGRGGNGAWGGDGAW